MYYQVVIFTLHWYGIISLGSADVYYVSANGSCSYPICNDFNTYLELFPKYFNSNTTFVFLPGNHSINSEIPSISNLNNFEFVGIGDFVEYSIDYNVKQYGFVSYNMDSTITYRSSSSIIVCNTSTYFSLTDITNLTIANLTFLNCGNSSAGALLMKNINSLLMDGVSVQNSTGYGILGINLIGNSQVSRSSFIGNNQYVKGMLQTKFISDNSCNPIIAYWNNGNTEPSQYIGGNVLIQYTNDAGILNSTKNLLISSCLFSLGLDCNYGNFNFNPLSNVTGTGLAVYAESNYFVNIILTNITSYRNQAYYGAGINIVCTLVPFSFIMENIRVVSGVAFYGGGISYLTAGTNSTSNTGITLSQITISNSIYRNNYAQIKGSSLYVASQNQLVQNNNSVINVSLYTSLITCEVGYSSLDVQVSSYSVVFIASNIVWQNTNLTNAAVFSGSNNLSQAIINMYQCRFPSSGFLISVKNSILYSYGCNFSDAAIGFQSYYSTVIMFQSTFSNTLQWFMAMNSTIQLNDCVSIGSGAITASQSLINATSNNLVLSNNSCGAIQLVLSTMTLQNSDMQFLFNNACTISDTGIFGGALYLNQSVVSFINSSVQFEGNYAYVGGAVYLFLSRINFISSNLQCSNNNADYYGGCMYLQSSILSLENTASTVFSQNTAHNSGGALFFSPNSSLDITAPSEIVFSNNNASLTGGAIYVQEFTQLPQPCFYTLSGLNDTLQIPNIVLTFNNNSAQAGSALYGGNIDNCILSDNANPSTIFDMVFKIGESQNSISSIPYNLCKCPMQNSSVCNPVSTFDKPVYPGQQIVIQFAATGQRNGAAPAVVLPVFYTKSTPMILSPLLTENECYNYSIPHYLNGTSVLVVTQSSFYSINVPFSNFTVTTNLLPCPLGFSLNSSSNTTVPCCQCNPVISGQVAYCNITDVTIQKMTQYVWIGTASDETVAYSEYCLQEVCQNSFIFLPEAPNSQCANGHTGIMCSGCESNLSITLGMPKCQACSDDFLSLVIVFAAMGVAFTAILFVLNLTVYTGTMNGFLWYTFVINLNYFIFFNAKSFDTHGVIFIFPAWFNFDFGIVSCFYEGMDMYSYTWLQLAFPTFIFSLIGVIIICAQYSLAISRLCRSNAVPVLATLIYISLSKLVRMIVAALWPVKIVSASGTRWMWLYDGNIEYFGDKHLPLAAFALLLLLFVVFPYTAILLLAPWLQRFSHIKCLLWVNKLKPFLDNYQAPYKDQFRYWTGATLLFRFILCIITTYYSNNPDVILVAIVVLHVSIILVAGIAIYKNWILSILESFFNINITIMATLLLSYQDKSDDSTTTVVWLGVGSSLLCFVGILSYHVYSYLIRINSKCKPKQNRNDEGSIVQATEEDLLLS